MQSISVSRSAASRPSWRTRRRGSVRAIESGSGTGGVASALTAPAHTIAFWTDQMCERGTEVAVYDYADGAEAVLGYCSWVLYDAGCERNFDGCIDRFVARFGERVVGLHGFGAVDTFLAAHSEIKHLYQIKCDNDGLVSKRPGVRNYVHAVFDAGDPYGDVYAKISPCVPGSCPVVPHIVRAQ